MEIRNGMEWNGIEWNGIDKWNGINGIKWNIDR
jgi:hypothetical protein